eukprot:357017-Chlamydomonas_euryale.AAC.5
MLEKAWTPAGAGNTLVDGRHRPTSLLPNAMQKQPTSVFQNRTGQNTQERRVHRAGVRIFPSQEWGSGQRALAVAHAIDTP